MNNYHVFVLLPNFLMLKIISIEDNRIIDINYTVTTKGDNFYSAFKNVQIISSTPLVTRTISHFISIRGLKKEDYNILKFVNQQLANDESYVIKIYHDYFINIAQPIFIKRILS